jgi:hypothetical protein
MRGFCHRLLSKINAPFGVDTILSVRRVFKLGKQHVPTAFKSDRKN